MKNKKKWLKLLLIIATITIMSAPIRGQTASYNGVNDIVVFGGMSAQRLNLNTYSYFYGTYLDYIPWKSTRGYGAGLFLTANQSRYVQNLQRFSGSGLQLAGGISLGRYITGISHNGNIFIGINIGLMYSRSKGRNLSDDFHNQQDSWLLLSSLNFNFLRTTKSWPRSQLLLTAEPQLKALELSWWEGQSRSGSVWNMGYYQALFKQSIRDIALKRSWMLSPKFIGSYDYSVGNSQGTPGIGGEISLHRKYKDDFLSVYYLYKFGKTSREDTFSFGIIVNFSN